MRKKIKPLFVKDSKNKVIEVYLDIKTYDAIVDKIKKFNKSQLTKTKAKKQKAKNIA